ncbi:hypothetical protein MKMG_02068 [Methanogenium sp. MK-MG]|nr:hypothetical protein MKMG_02068 [Methanogenium sp. MK-MG]
MLSGTCPCETRRKEIPPQNSSFDIPDFRLIRFRVDAAGKENMCFIQSAGPLTKLSSRRSPASGFLSAICERIHPTKIMSVINEEAGKNTVIWI